MKSNLFKFFAALFCATVCIGFSSCGDDDEEESPANGLIGSWEEAGYLQNNQIVWYQEEGDIVTYNADGTMAWYDDGDLDAVGTYTLEGNVITTYLRDAEDSSNTWDSQYTYRIEGDILYLTYLDAYGPSDTEIYRRIR